MRHSAISLPAVIKVYLKKKKKGFLANKRKGVHFSLKNWGFDTLRDREKTSDHTRGQIFFRSLINVFPSSQHLSTKGGYKGKGVLKTKTT